MVTVRSNVAWPTYANVGAAPNKAHLSAFTALCRLLVDPKASKDSIEEILKTEDFAETQYCLLFAHIRQPVIDMLWEHRQSELWIFRSEKLGTTYAKLNAIESSMARYTGKFAFQQEHDELLEIGNGGVDELKAMIVQHVGVLREDSVRLSELRAKKAELLEAHTPSKKEL